MKAVLAFDLGEEFVADLRASFPEVEFVTAYSEEEQLAQAPDAEIFFGTISRAAFLAAALASGEIAGAGCDALWPEPPAPDSPLWDLPNLLISPHSSAHSPQMWERRRQIFKENLGRYLAGEPLMFVCDRKRGY